MAFAALTIDLNARLAKFEQDMARAGKSLDGLDRRASAAAAGLKSAFGAMGAALSVGALASFAKSGIDAADAMNDMSLRTGVAVKTLAGFKLAAEQSGTDLDSMAKGIQKLTLSMGQAEAGSKEQAAALTRLGVTARDPQQAFEQLADAVANSNDPIKTNADLQKVLGKNYAELLPLLQGGAQGLRDSAAASATFAEQMAKLAPDADKFNDNLALLKTNAAGAAATLINQLVPALNNVFERFSRLSKLDSATLFEKFTGQVSANLPSSIANVNGKIKDLEANIERLARNSGGRDSSILPLTQELARLKQLKQELRTLSMGEAMKIADAQYKKTPAGYGAPDKVQPPTGKPVKTRTKSGPDVAGMWSDDVADGIKRATEELDKYYETERMVAEFDLARDNEINAITKAWTDAGAALTDQVMTPLEKANNEFGRLQELLDRGVISWETYSRAQLAVQDGLDKTGEKLSETQDQLSVFAEQAGKNIQDAFADFLINPFDKGMKGMLQSFGQTIQKMIAQAVAADLAKRIFNWGDSGGGSGSLLGSIATAVFSGARADGGPVSAGSTYLVGERGPELFRASTSGSIVPNHALGGLGGGHTIIVNVNGGNAPDVRRAAAQGAREALGFMSGAQRYA